MGTRKTGRRPRGRKGASAARGVCQSCTCRTRRARGVFELAPREPNSASPPAYFGSCRPADATTRFPLRRSSATRRAPPAAAGRAARPHRQRAGRALAPPRRTTSSPPRGGGGSPRRRRAAARSASCCRRRSRGSPRCARRGGRGGRRRAADPAHAAARPRASGRGLRQPEQACASCSARRRRQRRPPRSCARWRRRRRARQVARDARKGSGQAELNNARASATTRTATRSSCATTATGASRSYQLLRDATTARDHGGRRACGIAPPVMRERHGASTPRRARRGWRGRRQGARDRAADQQRHTIGGGDAEDRRGGRRGSRSSAAIASSATSTWHRVQIFCAVSGRYLRKWGRRGGRSGRGHCGSSTCRGASAPPAACSTNAPTNASAVITPGGAPSSGHRSRAPSSSAAARRRRRRAAPASASRRRAKRRQRARPRRGARSALGPRAAARRWRRPNGSWLRNERAWATEVARRRLVRRLFSRFSNDPSSLPRNHGYGMRVSGGMGCPSAPTAAPRTDCRRGHATVAARRRVTAAVAASAGAGVPNGLSGDGVRRFPAPPNAGIDLTPNGLSGRALRLAGGVTERRRAAAAAAASPVLPMDTRPSGSLPRRSAVTGAAVGPSLDEARGRTSPTATGNAVPSRDRRWRPD